MHMHMHMHMHIASWPLPHRAAPLPRASARWTQAGPEAGWAEQLLLVLLQLICCVWVTIQVYSVDFKAAASLVAYRDFNRWLLPLKGETVRKMRWVMGLPMLQCGLGAAIVGVSCTMICACSTGFDAVMNSLAFTFISTVTVAVPTPALVPIPCARPRPRKPHRYQGRPRPRPHTLLSDPAV